MKTATIRKTIDHFEYELREELRKGKYNYLTKAVFENGSKATLEFIHLKRPLDAKTYDGTVCLVSDVTLKDGAVVKWFPLRRGDQIEMEVSYERVLWNGLNVTFTTRLNSIQSKPKENADNWVPKKHGELKLLSRAPLARLFDTGLEKTKVNRKLVESLLKNKTHSEIVAELAKEMFLVRRGGVLPHQEVKQVVQGYSQAELKAAVASAIDCGVMVNQRGKTLLVNPRILEKNKDDLNKLFEKHSWKSIQDEDLDDNLDDILEPELDI